MGTGNRVGTTPVPAWYIIGRDGGICTGNRVGTTPTD